MSAPGPNEQKGDSVPKIPCAVGTYFALDVEDEFLKEGRKFARTSTRWVCNDVNGMMMEFDQETGKCTYTSLPRVAPTSSKADFVTEGQIKICPCQTGTYTLRGIINGTAIDDYRIQTTKPVGPLTFCVDAPRIKIDDITGGVKVENEITGAVNVLDTGHLRFGRNVAFPGIVFKAYVYPPEVYYPAKFGFIQIVKGWRKYSRFQGDPVLAGTNNEWYLDAYGLPYGGPKRVWRVPSPPPPPKPGEEPPAKEPIVMRTVDGPAIVLRDGCKEVEVRETFRMYVAYKRTDVQSRWITLGYTEWNWHGKASRAAANAKWEPDKNVDSPAVGGFVLTTIQPTWTNTIKAVRAEINKQLGDAKQESKEDGSDDKDSY